MVPGSFQYGTEAPVLLRRLIDIAKSYYAIHSKSLFYAQLSLFEEGQLSCRIFSKLGTVQSGRFDEGANRTTSPKMTFSVTGPDLVPIRAQYSVPVKTLLRPICRLCLDASGRSNWRYCNTAAGRFSGIPIEVGNSGSVRKNEYFLKWVAQASRPWEIGIGS